MQRAVVGGGIRSFGIIIDVEGRSNDTPESLIQLNFWTTHLIQRMRPQVSAACFDLEIQRRRVALPGVFAAVLRTAAR